MKYQTLWFVEEFDPKRNTWVALPVWAFNRRMAREKLKAYRKEFHWRKFPLQITKYTPEGAESYV